MDNKKNKRGLEDELANVLEYAETQLESGKELYVLGRTGKNEEIAITIAILCSMFTENCKSSCVISMRHIWWQIIGFFSDEFVQDKTTREEMMHHFSSIDKQFIKRKLMFIQSFVHDAAPSRNLIKGLNRYFLS